MSQGQDTKRLKCLEKALKRQDVTPDPLNESSKGKTRNERRLREALIIDPEDEVGFLDEIEASARFVTHHMPLTNYEITSISKCLLQEMLMNDDSQLKYVLNEEAIENPFIADRETQLRCLMNFFCQKKISFFCKLFNSLFCFAVEGKKKADGGYKCAVCNEEHNDIDGMQQHLLYHSNCKFYLCMQCFEGFNTLSEMECHTKTHVDENVPPTSSPRISEKLQSFEGPASPRFSIFKELQVCPTEENRRRNYRCNMCGSTFDRLNAMLFHTEQEHPAEREGIEQLRLRVLQTSLDLKGNRPANADEEESASSSTA
ncbi:Zinc finger protein 44 [Taenia solium]|eukprot:TsM_000346500 transcript=TsM_000346500 gene=TsM_000346500